MSSERGNRPRQGNGFYLCRCTVCGREDRTGLTPLRDGWPKCCGYTMHLVETERFIASVDRQVGAVVARAEVQRG
jgi:hypothetical protein